MQTATEVNNLQQNQFVTQARIDRLTSLIDFGHRRLEVIEQQQEHLASVPAHDELGRQAIQLQQKTLQRQKENTVRLRDMFEKKRAILLGKQTAGDV